MFGTVWFTLRQVREALRTAARGSQPFVGQQGVRGHKRAYQLQEQVIKGFVDRAERNLRVDAVAAAWEDVRKAELLAPNDPAVERFRQRLLSLGRAEVKAALEAGRPGRAAEAIARLRDRGARPAEVQPFDDAARSWLLARETADAGEFAVALQTVDRIRKLMPQPTTGLDDFRTQLSDRQENYQRGIIELHEAVRKEMARGGTAGRASAQLSPMPRSPQSPSNRLESHRNPTRLCLAKPPSASEIAR